jgi:quinoprotein relay system zinc metallohydrolase 2
MILRMLSLIGLFLIAALVKSAPLPLESLGEGIYVHHGVHEDISEGYHGDICNISFVIGEKGIAVIDTGGDLKTGLALKEAIRQVSKLPILYVINTHVHPDHIFGNAAFKEDHPTFVGHEKLPDAMEKRRDTYLRISREWIGSDFDGSEMIKPTLLVKDEVVLDLGGRTLTLHAYPTAHTNTDITVFDSKSATIWTGDLLFVERTPSIDGDIKGWLTVIDLLKKSPATQAIPGHSNRIDHMSWKDALGREQNYLSVLLTDVRQNIKNGVTMEKSMDSAASSERGKWQLFDIINRRNVNAIYPALEWE